jgi:hypothetical protein
VRTVPERSLWLQIITVLGGFLLGPYGAHRLSLALSPDSVIVQTVGFFGLALVFFGGTVLWMGVGIATVVVRGLWSLVRGRLPGPVSADPADRLVPPGYASYAWLGAVLGSIVGVVAAVATDLGALMALGVWTGLGIGYGLVLSAAAHFGYLPFPEPE